MSDVSHLNSKEDIRMLSLSQSVKEEREIVVVVKRLQRDLYSSTVFAARVTRVNTQQFTNYQQWSQYNSGPLLEQEANLPGDPVTPAVVLEGDGEVTAVVGLAEGGAGGRARLVRSARRGRGHAVHNFTVIRSQSSQY